eukprot:g10812.t1
MEDWPRKDVVTLPLGDHAGLYPSRSPLDGPARGSLGHMRGLSPVRVRETVPASLAARPVMQVHLPVTQATQPSLIVQPRRMERSSSFTHIGMAQSTPQAEFMPGSPVLERRDVAQLRSVPTSGWSSGSFVAAPRPPVRHASPLRTQWRTGETERASLGEGWSQPGPTAEETPLAGR